MKLLKPEELITKCRKASKSFPNTPLSQGEWGEIIEILEAARWRDAKKEAPECAGTYLVEGRDWNGHFMGSPAFFSPVSGKWKMLNGLDAMAVDLWLPYPYSPEPEEE